MPYAAMSVAIGIASFVSAWMVKPAVEKSGAFVQGAIVGLAAVGTLALMKALK